MKIVQNQLQSDQETWQQCIYDIQEHTMNSLSDVFSRPELKHPSTPPLLYIDPAYGENAGAPLSPRQSKKKVWAQEKSQRKVSRYDLGTSEQCSDKAEDWPILRN